MNLKPFVNICFCYSCKSPVPRAGISMRTKAGNITMSTPFYCPKCAAKRRKFEEKLGKK